MICMISLYWNSSWRQNSKSQPQHNILNRANKRVICLSRFQTEFLATPVKEIPLHINSLSQRLPSQRRTEEKKERKQTTNALHHLGNSKLQFSLLFLFSWYLCFDHCFNCGADRSVYSRVFTSSLKFSTVPTCQVW